MERLNGIIHSRMNVRKLYPIPKIDPNDTKIELNCRTIKPVLMYFEEKYGKEKLAEFIFDTRMNLDYLENSHNWVSFAYFCRLFAKLVQYTGDPKVPFTVGLYTTKKECYGPLANIVKRLGSPGTAYRLITEITPRYSKLGTFQISKLTKNSCVITTTYFDRFKQDKNNCLNVQGIFASIPTFFDLPLAKVKEVECAAEGGKHCMYEIFWHNKPSHLFGLCGTLIGLIIFYVAKTFLWKTANIFILATIPITGYLIGRIKDYKITLNDSILANERKTKDLMESVETIEKLNIDLQDMVEQRTQELSASNKELQDTLDKLKKSQNQLIQSEKMASVGQLAAGMAHELNNPVGAIRNYIQDVLEDTQEDDPYSGRLKKAEKATGRCKRLVSDLLTFSRESKELKSVDINDMVEATILNAKEEIANPKINVLKELDAGLPRIKLDPLQIQQVFMNVIMNAGDAIKDEGRVTVKTYKTAENIFIEVSDTGEGIPEEIRDKIFDPFFTTKSSRKGKGLGLAISYNIIKRFNGDIKVTSKKGEGTTITLILPLYNTNSS